MPKYDCGADNGSTLQSPDLAPEELLKVTVLLGSDNDTEIRSPSGRITLKVPKGAVSTPVKVELAERFPGDSTGMRILNRFELTAWRADSTEKVTQFNKNLEITIRHTPEELSGLDIDSLRLYFLDEQKKQWLPIPTSKYDSEQRVLTASITHFTHFGEQANPVLNGPGRVMAAQVSLHSGTAVFSYPIELPPGPGGFQPKLELTYNSGIADEMKNKRSTGSWVGIGWTLHLGRISYDLADGRYFLDLNGASYELASSDGTNYRTNPEQYLKVTRSGNTWGMWDREGVYYRFGGTTDSQQYLPASEGGYYRWDVSLVRDPNNNQAAVSYVRDIRGGSPNDWVRSAYPEYLTYGNVEVHFVSGWDEIDPTDGYLRKDAPKSYGSNPAPKVMENRKLNSIEIRVSGVLIRKYTVTYNTTDRVYSGDYGGIYYSGKHTLTSIAQIGADGTSQLPAMAFIYQDLQTHRHTNEGDYNGNPGNPASFTWPHLTAVSSGYGGTISFAYAQKPDTTALNIWTREVVTSRTVNSGIGTSGTNSYTYTGNPQYLGASWDQTYRGFGEIRETDAVGNYVNHWFYTTGILNGKEAEKLTGKEYKTQWYSSSGTLLKENLYDWTATQTGQIPCLVSVWGTYAPVDIAMSSDGYAYVTTGDYVQKYDANGNFVLQWGGFGASQGQFYRPRGITVSSDGYVFVADVGNYRIQKFDANGNYVSSFSVRLPNEWNIEVFPQDVAVSSDGYIYVPVYRLFWWEEYTTFCYWVRKFTSAGSLVQDWETVSINDETRTWVSSEFRGAAISGDGYVYLPSHSVTPVSNQIRKYDGNGNLILQFGSGYLRGVAISNDGHVYVTDEGNYRAQKYDANGNYVLQWGSYGTGDFGFNSPSGIAVWNSEIYVTQKYNNRVQKFSGNWAVRLNQVDEIVGTKTSRMRYSYGAYGNIITEYLDGDTSTANDDATIWRAFYPNTSDNILSKPARERVYATIVTADTGGSNLKGETLYYYDNSTSHTTPPTKGNLTRIEQKKGASSPVSTYFTYDTYGNKLAETDPNNNTTTYTYDANYHTYPATKSYPVTGLTESYTYDPGTTNLLTVTDVNGQVTTYQYDTFKRLTKVIKPGDSEASPGVEYQYNSWGTVGSQHIKTITKTDAINNLWQKQYFDGLGRVVQVHSTGEPKDTHTIISSTTTFNNRGLVDRQYISQDLASIPTSYVTPDAGWKYTTFAYDGLGRVTTQTNADGTTVTSEYSNTDWITLVTNERSYKKRYYHDAFRRLAKVEELNESQQVYATTIYTYDVLGNLKEVRDNNNNLTSMNYDWLSRKTSMTDPDMGNWSYTYYDNGNLWTQTDAKSQTITFVYDALNRLTGKTYTPSENMTPVSYSYDGFEAGVNFGRGKRTGMTDVLGFTSYKYDARGRLIEEKRTVDGTDHVTKFGYDGADRNTWVLYPTGENVTQSYNGRGFANTLSGTAAGNLITGVLYNNLGQVTDINLGNGLKTTFGYWGVGGSHDTTGGYYGRLWEIKTFPQAGGDAIQDVKHTWDAGGNLSQRENVLASETETFGYDFLDRLTSVSGPYSGSYTYNQIGNMMSRNGTPYTYPANGVRPHAVTSVGSAIYVYDNNGNMTWLDNGNAVSSLSLTNGGSGYTSPPSVTFSGGGGSGATATATLAPAAVSELTLTSGGSSYTSVPTITITGGGGTGATATATATLAGRSVGSITVTNGGSGYTSAPAVTLSGGGGSGATAEATLAPTSVTGITLTNGGSGYTSAPTVSFSGGGGSGATATATLAPAPVGTLTLTNGGTGYTSAPTVTISGGGGSGATATSTLAGTSVASITVTDQGRNYTSTPTVTISGGGGSGATAVATVQNKKVTAITVTNGGSGYTSVPTVNITGGGGSGAAGTAVLAPTSVGSVTLTNGGSGYTSEPTVSFSGGGGSGAAATATLAPRAVGSLTLTNGGSAYTSSPGVTIAGGGGSGATATATLTGTAVGSVSVTNGGSGYSSSPAVSFSGGGGSGAAGTSELAPAAVASIALTHGGSGYTSAPAVGFSGGGGSGAAATATLAPRPVSSLTLTNGGRGYTSTPDVTISGGGGSGATATATIAPLTQTIAWDVENRPVSITSGNNTSTFVYDGDGNRVKKTEAGQTILYINRYYEKNLTSGNVTTYYYLGDRLVAMRQGTTLTYVHQDHLTGTSVVSDSTGALVNSIKYFPFGGCRNSPPYPTDKLFTGQRLDGTGLYYYGARYYDPTIGRFISPDTFMLSPSNPQGLNRYAYAFNNPLRYNDPTGNWPPFLDKFISQAKDVVGQGVNAVKQGLQVAASKTVEIYQTAKELPGKAQEAAMHAVGIERVEYYTDTRSIKDPVPVYYVADKGIVSSLLGEERSGISLYPIGTFVRESALAYDPNIPAHESKHYSEQRDWGMLWYAGYGIEVAARDVYYWDTFWGYYTSSFEQRARDYAGEQSLSPPDPRWQEPLNNFTQSVGSYLETIGNYYYDYYWYYGY